MEETGFPSGSDGEESTCNVGDLGSNLALGRSLGGGHSNPLQYSCLENPHGQRSLAGYSPWGCEDSDTTEGKSRYSKKICKVFSPPFQSWVKTWHACEEARYIPEGQSSGLNPPKAHLGKQKWCFLKPAPSRDMPLHQHLEPLFLPLRFWKWKGNFLKRSPTLAL